MNKTKIPCNTNKHWSEEQDTRLDRMIRSGYGMSHIAKCIGRSVPAIHRRLELKYPNILPEGKSFYLLPQNESIAEYFHEVDIIPMISKRKQGKTKKSLDIDKTITEHKYVIQENVDDAIRSNTDQIVITINALNKLVWKLFFGSIVISVWIVIGILLFL